MLVLKRNQQKVDLRSYRSFDAYKFENNKLSWHTL